MEVLDAIYKRRSIRQYLDQEVDQETILTLLKAATAAPTAANYQPWEFIVVTEKERLEKLRNELAFGKYNAPVAIVVCGNLELALKGPDQEMWVQDCSAALENILLAATGLGLGAVWIGVYPVENRVTALKKLYNMPEQVIPMSVVYVGYPAEEKEGRTQFDEKRVYWQEYEPKRKHRAKDKPKKN